MIVKKNAYGYTNVNDITGIYTFEDFYEEYSYQIGSYITNVVDPYLARKKLLHNSRFAVIINSKIKHEPNEVGRV